MIRFLGLWKKEIKVRTCISIHEKIVQYLYLTWNIFTYNINNNIRVDQNHLLFGQKIKLNTDKILFIYILLLLFL